MEKIPVIIDCDPGHDDVAALVLAVGSGRLDIRAVTTVAGNNTIENTTKNALDVLAFLGAGDIPVAAGAAAPLVRTKEEVSRRIGAYFAALHPRRPQPKPGAGEGLHGGRGLHGVKLPDSGGRPVSGPAVETMARILEQSAEPVTLITLGPLTNPALLLRDHPHLRGKIRRICAMCGTCSYVLTRPGMEFNAFVDPEATRAVFSAGVPITMFGYDVTCRTCFGQQTIDRMQALDNAAGPMMARLLESFRSACTDAHGLSGDRTPIHDACAVAGVIDPTLVTASRSMRVDINVGGSLLDGATVCDEAGVLSELPQNAEVVFGMDTDRFLELLVRAAGQCR